MIFNQFLKVGILFFFAILFLNGVAISGVSNVSNTQKVGVSDSKLIVKILDSDDEIIDNTMVALLSQFKSTPNNLKIIRQLSVQGEQLTKYIEQQFNYPIKRQKLLMYLKVLSLSNNMQADKILLSIGEKYSNDSDITFYLLKILREKPQSDYIQAYYSFLLNKFPDGLNILPATLLSIVIAKSPDTRQLSMQYRSPGISSEVRFMGLYMASTLGKDEILKDWILQILFDDTPPPVYQHYYLLIALSRQMTDEYFYDFLSRSYVDSNIIESVKLERKFYQGDTKTRMNLALKLANSSHPDQSMAAISFLLKHQGFEKTWLQLNKKQRLSAIRLSYKLDIPIFIEKDKKKLINGDNKSGSASAGNFYYLYCLVISLLIIIMFWKYIGFKKNKKKHTV